MFVESMDQLDHLSDDDLWEAAADTRNTTDIRHDAIQRWLFPEEGDDAVDSGSRLMELRERATIIDSEEIEEDDIEDIRSNSTPYFDGEGRLIVEHDGLSYLVDSLNDVDYDPDFTDDNY